MSAPAEQPAHAYSRRLSYTISWNRTANDVNLDGVEYKSLPSGLHSVNSDLVYFVHGSYAGVSAYLQEESDAQHRNANFVAVGALVPLSYGRLGKSWLHALELRQLAREWVNTAQDTRALDDFWKNSRLDEAAAKAEIASPSAVRRVSLPHGPDRKRKRADSDAVHGFPANHDVPPDHPALSVPQLLDTLGPLLFPLYRAALLRKRILILGPPPVQRSCDFVYMLSTLSSIPQALSDVVQPDTEDLLRMQTLFNVGIHDIPYLSENKRRARWLACTTDDILAEKHHLYDILVSLPGSTRHSRVSKRWPDMQTSDGVHLKATQRDLRRYRLLRTAFDRLQSDRRRYRDDPDNADGTGRVSPLMRASTTNLLHEVRHSAPGEGEVVEPVSWAAMAYNGFMWWASAGEMEAWENEEARTDRQLLDDLPEMEGLLQDLGDDSDDHDTHKASTTATVVIAYFYRLTAQIIQPLAHVVEDADDDTEEGIAESGILVSADDMKEMGLDAWSVTDKEFVKSAMESYFGREAIVEEDGTRVCGVRIC